MYVCMGVQMCVCVHRIGWGEFANYLVVSIGCAIVVIGCNNRGASIGILSLKLSFGIDCGFD